MNLFFCGDIMPGGVLPYQDHYITLELLDYLKSFDFRIGTLEAAIGTDLPYDPVKMAGRQNIVYARNEDFFRVKEMGFDVVSLANNHVWDLGEEGLRNTIKVLQENGIKYCGAGLNIEEASRPAIIEKDGMKIAILAYCMYGNPWLGYVELAGENKAGVNPLDIEKVVYDIKDAKQKYDKAKDTFDKAQDAFGKNKSGDKNPPEPPKDSNGNPLPPPDKNSDDSNRPEPPKDSNGNPLPPPDRN